MSPHPIGRMSWANTYIMILRMLIMMVLVPNLLENVYHYEHHQHDEHILQHRLEHIQCVVAPTIVKYLKRTYHIFVIYFTNI